MKMHLRRFSIVLIATFAVADVGCVNLTHSNGPSNGVALSGEPAQIGLHRTVEPLTRLATSSPDSGKRIHVAAKVRVKSRKIVRTVALNKIGGRGPASEGSGGSGSSGNSDVCQITVSSCPMNPSYRGSFVDPDTAAGEGASACVARAQYWHDWCGADSVTASFWSGSTLIGKGRYDTLCQISEDSCQSNRSYVGTFTAPDQGANSGQPQCMAEAAKFQGLCQSHVSSAAFYVNGALVQTQTYPQTSSCMITQDSCANYPAAAGQFQDSSSEGNSDAASCMARTAYYQGVCGGNGATTASFYADGELVQSSTVGTACKVNLPDCPNHPAYVGAFTSDDGQASTGVDPCLALADRYRTWCGGSAAEASFYKNGNLVQTTTSGASALGPESLAAARSSASVGSGGTVGGSITGVPTASLAAPPTPRKFTISDPGSGSLFAKWESGGGTTDGYYLSVNEGNVHKSCMEGTKFVRTRTTYRIDLLKDGTKYTFALCAVNAKNGKSAAAIAQGETRPATARPPLPVNFIATPLTETEISLSWGSGIGSTTGFMLAMAEGATPPSCSTGTALPLTTTSITKTRLSAGTEYSFALCAVNSTKLLSYIPVTLSTATLPPRPTNFVMTAHTDTTISVAWDESSSSVTGFQLAGDVSCANGLSLGNVRSYTLTSLNPSKTYELRLCAKNAYAVSKPAAISADTTAIPAPPAPVGLKVTADGGYSIVASWGSGGGTTSVFFIALGSNCDGSGVEELKATSYTFNGLSPATSYSVALCAVNKNGLKSETVVGSATTDSCTTKCSDYEDVCVGTKTVCDGYACEGYSCTDYSCSEYDTYCDGYDSYGKCDDYATRCDEYACDSSVCDGYSCTGYSYPCDDYEEECEGYTTTCQLMRQKSKVDGVAMLFGIQSRHNIINRHCKPRVKRDSAERNWL